MRKIIFIFTMMLVFANEGISSPAFPNSYYVKINTGETIKVHLVGDEYGHWLETEDGLIVEKKNDGIYYLSGTNKIEEKIKNRDKLRKIKMNKKAGINKPAITRNIHSNKKNIVLLIEFDDVHMQETNSQKEFNRMFNEQGYHENQHVGSVHDYFHDQSYGMLNIDFDVIGPIRLNKPCHYYGENGEYGDRHVGSMISEAIDAIKDTLDFSKYDWNGDGFVEQIIAIYAGYGEHAGASDSTIWPHCSSLSNAYECGDGNGVIKIDNISIDTYVVTSELIGHEGNKLAGIGTICHEFCHTLGLPDFYDTGKSGGFGMKRWDVMDIGNYNGPTNNGEVPSGFTAYERWFMGWLEPTELTDRMEIINMHCIGDEPTAYVLYNPGNKNEYYLLENRSPQNRWFQYLGKNNAIENNIKGLLITHVDYDEEAWKYDSPNSDPSHQRMTIIPASNIFGTYNGDKLSINSYQYRNHLFPSTDGNNMLTDASLPRASLYNKNEEGNMFMSTPITNIQYSDSDIASFDFNHYANLEIPTGLSAEHICDSIYKLEWNPVCNASGYNIEYQTTNGNSIIRNISFPYHTIQLPKGHNCKFRVQPFDYSGLQGKWSDYFVISTASNIQQYNNNKNHIIYINTNGIATKGTNGILIQRVSSGNKKIMSL